MKLFRFIITCLLLKGSCASAQYEIVKSMVADSAARRCHIKTATETIHPTGDSKPHKTCTERYDTLGRRVDRTYFDSYADTGEVAGRTFIYLEEQLKYNADNRVINGQVVTYLKNDTLSVVDLYSYNKNGTIARIKDYYFTIDHTYDKKGRVVEIKYTRHNMALKRTQYKKTKYSYDAGGRLKNCLKYDGDFLYETINYTVYNDNGQLLAEEDNTFDPKYKNPVLEKELKYNYDINGLLLKKEEFIPGKELATVAYIYTYAYY